MKKSMYKRTSSDQSGFTMVELVVVIAIVGTLSLFALPRYRGAIEKARVSQALSFMAQIQASQERYAIGYGTYSDELHALDVEYQMPLGYRLKQLTVGVSGDRWRMSLERDGARNGYGRYDMEWTERVFDPFRSSLPDHLYPAGISRNLLQRSQGVSGNPR